MSVFFHLSSLYANAIAKFSLIAFCVSVLILSSCDEPELGMNQDITEDLHHRLSAGMFKPGKDPFFIRIHTRGRSSKSQPAVGSFVHFSWENGSFSVKADEGASVVMYMDTEAIFSHINFSADRRYSLSTLYTEYPQRPVVTTHISSD